MAYRVNNIGLWLDEPEELLGQRAAEGEQWEQDFFHEYFLKANRGRILRPTPRWTQ